MNIHMHVLKGCSPTPLAHYLKAVAILRLVGEQADPQARGYWDGEQFVLLTRMSRECLENFFLHEYQPTPMVAPWNGGSGFFPKDNRKAIDLIAQSTSKRFVPFRAAIAEGKASTHGLKAKPDKKQKPAIFRFCITQWRGAHRNWLDAALVFDESEKPIFPALLGTGGNDGRLDFTNNFMQQLVSLFDVASATGAPHINTSHYLRDAFWSEPSEKLVGAAVGQYLPGSAGGANSSTGFSSGNLVNPWDFVLMLEGTILFACRATRRFDPNALSRASAPFAVRPHAAGYITPGLEKSQRGEQWMPLWDRPATLADIRALLGEARVQLHRQPANRPVDMARAVSRLGVARGIKTFVRFGYLERNGQANLAIPLGRISVRHHPQTYLTDDLAPWLDRIQRKSRDKNATQSLIQAERRIADSVFSALTHEPSPARWQTVLRAAADLEALQALGAAIDAGPIPPLRPDWVEAVYDGSSEVRLALALGSAAGGYSHTGHAIDPVRHHLLPLERGARRFKTSEKRLMKDPRVVVTGRDPIRDLASIVERRLTEAATHAQRRLPLVPAPKCGAKLEDLNEFLQGSLDLDKLFSLARAFMAIRWDQWHPEMLPTADFRGPTPDESWLMIRLAYLPWPLDDVTNIPADPRIVRLLTSEDPTRAVAVARQRLVAAGIRPPLQAGVTTATIARLWAAALVFPIHRGTALRAKQLLVPSMKGTPRG
jgi:CRISPR-associated protein Csx17